MKPSLEELCYMLNQVSSQARDYSSEHQHYKAFKCWGDVFIIRMLIVAYHHPWCRLRE